MDMKDTLQLHQWLASKASLADVESASPYGLVGNVRFSPAAVRAYRLAWSWSAHRFGGPIGWRQETLWKRHGREFVEHRIARTRARIERFIKGV